ncbi:MAG: iron ABC transporter permease [Bacteroidota bacterium]
MRFLGLLLLLVLSFCANVFLGSVSFPWSDFPDFLSDPTYQTILLNLRLPEAIAACLVGAALSVSGLQMQTLFGNPLASPSILGITAGASLGAAAWVLLDIQSLNLGLETASLLLMAVLGAFLVLGIIVVVALRVRDRIGILLIGIMLGNLTFALVSIGQYFSSAEQIQNFLFWSLGDLSGLSYSKLLWMGAVVVLGLVFALALSKSLNAWLLGERYAQTLGISIRSSRLKIILLTGVLTGTVTAFVGPISFVGLAVPHVARMIINQNDHRVLQPAVMLMGAIFLLLCDTIAKVPGASIRLPLNAVTALLGSPIVIWVILRWRGR